jgi:hypothetical protein
MKVLWYLAVPVILVTVYCVVVWWRNRKPTSLQSGVDSFRREMQALSPQIVRKERRQAAPPPGGPPAPPGQPSRRR